MSTEETIERTQDKIDETRDRVRSRVDQLQDDLSLRSLFNQFIPEDQPMSDSINQVVDAAKRNPLATALVAGGIALIGKELAGERVNQAASRASRTAGKYADRVNRRTSGLGETAYDKAADLAETVQDTATSSARKIRQSSRQAISAAREQGEHAYEAGTDYARSGKRWVEENPVAAGLAAAAVGALVASYFTARSGSGSDSHDDEADKSSRRMPAERKSTAPARKTAAKSRKKASTGKASSKSAAGTRAAKSSSARKTAAKAAAARRSTVAKQAKVANPNASAVANGPGAETSTSRRFDS